MREVKEQYVKCTKDTLEDIIARFIDYVFLKVLGIDITYFPFLPNTEEEKTIHGNIEVFKQNADLYLNLEGILKFERRVIGLRIEYKMEYHPFQSMENLKIKMSIPSMKLIIVSDDRTPLRSAYDIIDKKEYCEFYVRYMMKSTGSEK